MFQNCTSLESITLPKNLTTISYGTFYSCTKLKHIEIPDSVTTVGQIVFKNCIGLETITHKKGLSIRSAEVREGCQVIRK